MNWFNRSMIPRMIAVLFVLIMTISGLFIFREYYSEKSLYMDFLHQRQELIAEMKLDDMMGAIKQASSMVQNKPINEEMTDSLFRMLRGRMNKIAGDDVINAFLIIKENEAKDGAPAFRILQANDNLESLGYKPNTAYDMPAAIQDAFLKLTTEDNTIMTDEFDMGDAVYITGLTEIRDDLGHSMAYLVTDYDYSIIKGTLIGFLVEAIVIGGIIGLIGILLVAVYVQRRLKPLNDIHKLAEQAANGDLTVKLASKRQDEIGRLADVFNRMTERLSGLLAEVQRAAKDVSTSSLELQRGAEETAIAAQEVASAMSEVANGSLEQQHSTEQTKSAMSEITAGAEQIATTSEQVAEWMREAAAQAGEGRVIVDETVVQMERIEAASADTNQAIAAWTEAVQQISGAVVFIQNTVKQTELLALNASIEASRAGEHGRGFQVVATEVRKLAEHSKQSLQSIMQLIDVIHTKRELTERATAHQQEAVQKGMATVKTADETFTVIAGSIGQASSRMEEYRSIAQQMSASCEEVFELIRQLNDIAEQSNDHTARVAATTEQQSALTEEISASVDSLLSLSRDLQKMLEQFKVNVKEQ
ncbi:methyl-accepting chemotaxis protein [Paenibacillus thiaminolyticus]|uniref:Methyl-accepting chemotaxis protein n=1 Tax=Paenibacillus thiaminolyticus TaxID=49283 RepID=A0AAP9DYM9_PANTH|nr:methyl-accepting chemotaxis protein [Paenibacillus thiaminolyticus]MCY9535348.1 methyl-accepting chemotaxis protein [Paenibacillus thiaminolyticus]MCY9603375.1 methyl-accepting chemotaxis protein [Paenibacillus thiaminolyticus]MCY9607382.1 methyl-accepting chemotaxis protein [Paenibacillus thiaminolyticus]MCY9616440.1 methyl-accepting chemotaxis protein [Paenibacillus thiaminolyticus]MCY9621276.1 methyl-accepting chemotaxis protein [Paenibacillus thiaminolyticus]